MEMPTGVMDGTAVQARRELLRTAPPALDGRRASEELGAVGATSAATAAAAAAAAAVVAAAVAEAERAATAREAEAAALVRMAAEARLAAATAAAAETTEETQAATGNGEAAWRTPSPESPPASAGPAGGAPCWIGYC